MGLLEGQYGDNGERRGEGRRGEARRGEEKREQGGGGEVDGKSQRTALRGSDKPTIFFPSESAAEMVDFTFSFTYSHIYIYI